MRPFKFVFQKREGESGTAHRELTAGALQSYKDGVRDGVITFGWPEGPLFSLQTLRRIFLDTVLVRFPPSVNQCHIVSPAAAVQTSVRQQVSMTTVTPNLTTWSLYWQARVFSGPGPPSIVGGNYDGTYDHTAIPLTQGCTDFLLTFEVGFLAMWAVVSHSTDK